MFKMIKKKKTKEDYVHHLIDKFETAFLAGIIAPQAIADHLNINGITTFNGKFWTSTIVNEFLNNQGIENLFLNKEKGKKSKSLDDKNKNFNALNNGRLRLISEATIGHYDRLAEDFWQNTKEHDVSQNYEAFLEAIEESSPCKILDLGCGPGRDLLFFHSLGHTVTGLDGSREFVAMARSHSSCEVLHQNFLRMTLPKNNYDGVFANASLFHIPSSELPRILLDVFNALKPRGIFFCSNPRGENDEGLSDERYGCFFNLKTWRKYVTDAGFSEVKCYFRPSGLPRRRQPWLVTVWRKRSE
jgi:2-polyprenyl-3-methyl-5-hydroxy-6-metoxy-1,4-benzoquinol methylase